MIIKGLLFFSNDWYYLLVNWFITAELLFKSSRLYAVTKAVFIYQEYSKNSNIVKYYYN